LAVGEGAVWLLDDESSLIRFDPITNAVTGTIELDGDPWSLEVGAGSVWVLIGEESTPVDDPNTRYGRVLRIDPETLEVTRTARISDVLLPGFGRPLAFGEGALWVTNMGAVTRITPDSGAIAASIPVPGSGCGPLAIGFGDGKVWTSFSGAWLTAIDPTTNTATVSVQIREPEGGGGSVFNIADAGDALWITRMATLLQRISTADAHDLEGTPTPCG
jgi:streptogramin lyase